MGVLRELEKEIQELEEEQTIVTKASATFSHFLQNNGILSINDALDEYANHQITEQKDTLAALKAKGENGERMEAIIEGLQHQLSVYKQERKVLEDAMKNSSPSDQENGGGVTLTEAQKQIKKLLSLKHIGQEIKKAKDAAEKAAHTSKVQFSEVQVQPIQKQMARSPSMDGRSYGGHPISGGHQCAQQPMKKRSYFWW